MNRVNGDRKGEILVIGENEFAPHTKVDYVILDVFDKALKYIREHPEKFYIIGGESFKEDALYVDSPFHRRQCIWFGDPGKRKFETDVEFSCFAPQHNGLSTCCILIMSNEILNV